MRKCMQVANFFLAIVCSFALVSCCRKTLPVSDLLEPPGLHWNASVEDTLDVLGISEVTSDEEVAYDYGGHDRRIYAKDVSLFGEKADVQLLFTQSNPANDASVGLCEVTYFFSNDAGMHSIQNQISRMYGEG